MKKVTGIGGVFFKAKDHEMMNAWYARHLGINMNPWGATFDWKEHPQGSTAFSISKESSNYYEGAFMLNFRVENLTELMRILKEEGVKMKEGIEESEFGKFGWVYDPEGNRIELWEPNDSQK